MISSRAGSMTPEVEARLREAFSDHHVVEFDPSVDVCDLLTPTGRIVIAGGDGTVGFLLRQLARSGHRIGLLSLGTYNNFARAIGIPQDLDAAIDVVEHGVARPVTLGRANGRPFLEAAAIGLFGEAIALGEAAKEGVFGALGDHIRTLTSARPFRYRLSGDLNGSGAALSLVFANTPTTGAWLPLGEGTPEEPHLDLSLRVGMSRTDLLARLIAGLLRRTRHAEMPDIQLEFRRLRVRTRPRVAVYADSERIGGTPVTVEADPGAVTIMVPAGAAGRAHGRGHVERSRRSHPTDG